MTNEKIMPCPFCGSDVTLADFTGRGDIYLACGCGYRSAVKESEAEAIAAHNQVAKAENAKLREALQLIIDTLDRYGFKTWCDGDPLAIAVRRGQSSSWRR